MNQAAIAQVRPWDRPFWKPVRRKEGVFAFLVLIHVLAIIGLILFPLAQPQSAGTRGIVYRFRRTGNHGVLSPHARA